MGRRKLWPQELAAREAEQRLTPKQRHALYTGEITMQFNHIQFILQEIFWNVITAQWGWILWNVISTDSTQRDMLDAVASIKFATDKPRLRRILWATKNLGQLSRYRNDFVHVPIMHDARGGSSEKMPVMPHAWAQPERVARMSSVQLDKLRALLLRDLKCIEQVVGSVSTSLMHEGVALRRIPRLQAHAFVEAAKPKPPHPTTKKSRKRQRRASPP